MLPQRFFSKDLLSSNQRIVADTFAALADFSRPPWWPLYSSVVDGYASGSVADFFFLGLSFMIPYLSPKFCYWAFSARPFFGVRQRLGE